MTVLLALKLLLVPGFLALISLVARRYGPLTAGWLAGLPVIVGPISFFIAVEQGAAFAADAARFTLASVFTVVVFGAAYANVAYRRGWAASLSVAVLAWFAAACLIAAMPLNLPGAVALALVSLLIAPRFYPAVAAEPPPVPLPPSELLLRMLAGATLTWIVTALAVRAGPAWSGVVSLAPVLTPVVAVFTHRRGGGVHAVVLLRGLAGGAYSLASFCLAVAVLLPRWDIAGTFSAASALALLVQGIGLVLRRRTHRDKTKAMVQTSGMPHDTSPRRGGSTP